MNIQGIDIEFERSLGSQLIGYKVKIKDEVIVLHPETTVSDRLIWKDSHGTTNSMYQAIGERIESYEM